MNTATGEFTGRVQYLPPNNNPLGQYNIAGRVDGDTISFAGVANIPGVGNTDVVWQGSIVQNDTRMEGMFAYWDWIWEQWVGLAGGQPPAVLRGGLCAPIPSAGVWN
ncbi:MAG: hypothetical protein C4335_01110 [Armatimonadota bacterium]